MLAADLKDAQTQHDLFRRADAEPYHVASVVVASLLPAVVETEGRLIAADALVTRGVLAFVPRPNGKRFIRRCITNKLPNGSVECLVADVLFIVHWGEPCDLRRAITSNSHSITQPVS